MHLTHHMATSAYAEMLPLCSPGEQAPETKVVPFPKAKMTEKLLDEVQLLPDNAFPSIRLKKGGRGGE